MSISHDQENKALLSCNNPGFSNNVLRIVEEDKYIHVDPHLCSKFGSNPIASSDL